MLSDKPTISLVTVRAVVLSRSCLMVVSAAAADVGDRKMVEVANRMAMVVGN